MTASIAEAAKGLRKADLAEVSLAVLGKKNASLSVDALKAALERPAIEILRTRFIGAGA